MLKKIRGNKIINNILFSYGSVILLTFNRTMKINSESFVDRLFSTLSVFNADTLLSSILFFSIFFVVKNFKNTIFSKKEYRVINVFSIIFGLIFSIGTDITYHHGLFRNSTSKFNIMLFIIIFFISIYVFRNILQYIYGYLLSIKIEFNGFRKYNKNSFLMMFLPIFLIRLIFFVVYFPGYFTWDSMYVITEAMGAVPLTN